MSNKEIKNEKNPLVDIEEETTDTVETNDIKEAPVKKDVKAKAPMNTEEGLRSDIKATKEALEKQEMFHFMIPLAQGEKKGQVHDCFVNGYHYPVTKGIMVIVPETIRDLLEQSYQMTSELGEDSRIDLDDEKMNALS